MMMKMLFASLAALCLATALGAPIAGAVEPMNVDADARFAEGNPPVIPHKISDNATGEVCLSCHMTGVDKAPLCPHPVRIYCTACHVRSDLGAPSQPATRAKKGKGGK
jgi:nitrate reductase cytochrome c-type subunit